MSAGVEIESIHHPKYNVKEQLDEFVAKRGEILACGTCLKARGQEDSEVCPVSTMIDCVNMVLWADRTVTF